MTTATEAHGDTFKFGRAFVSGKHRVWINGQKVFEGKLVYQQPQRIEVGQRQYVITPQMKSSVNDALEVFSVQIHEQGRLIHEGLYDQAGGSFASMQEAKTASNLQVCGIVGAALGLAAMMAGNIATGIIPGGAIGGAIGGGGGYLIGRGIGSLFVKKPPAA
jgi:hypothetical protein